jgi:hypothetical protein
VIADDIGAVGFFEHPERTTTASVKVTKNTRRRCIVSSFAFRVAPPVQGRLGS